MAINGAIEKVEEEAASLSWYRIRAVIATLDFLCFVQ
jgi:hypothetical protein